MDYQELQDKVRKLNGQSIFPGSDKDEEWNSYTLADEGVVKTVKHELLDNFIEVRKSSEDNWHQFVREIFWPPEKLQFLKDDLLRLSEDYTGSHHYAFTKREKGSLVMPDRMLELNRLHTLFKIGRAHV